MSNFNITSPLLRPIRGSAVLLCALFLFPMALLGQNSSSPGRVIMMTEGEVARKAVKIDTMKKSLSFLCGECEGRATGTEGSARAAKWIETRFKKIGAVPFGNSFVQEFTAPGGVTAHNVVGIVRGTGKYIPASYVIVMANYDALGIKDGVMYPGADSNASGVVAMLAMGDMLQKMHSIQKGYSSSIIFAATDAHHLGCSGAAQLYKLIQNGLLVDPFSGIPITPSAIHLVIDLEQIGSTLSPIHKEREDYVIMLGGDGWQNTSVSSLNGNPAINLDLGLDYYSSKDFTNLMYRTLGEQRVFVEAGLPVVVFTSGITMRNNKPDDTPSTINLPILRRRAWLAFHFMERNL